MCSSALVFNNDPDEPLPGGRPAEGIRSAWWGQKQWSTIGHVINGATECKSPPNALSWCSSLLARPHSTKERARAPQASRPTGPPPISPLRSGNLSSTPAPINQPISQPAQPPTSDQLTGSRGPPMMTTITTTLQTPAALSAPSSQLSTPSQPASQLATTSGISSHLFHTSRAEHSSFIVSLSNNWPPSSHRAPSNALFRPLTTCQTVQPPTGVHLLLRPPATTGNQPPQNKLLFLRPKLKKRAPV